MNKDQFEGKWHQIKGKIKEKWGKLTDNDLTQINGKYEQFVGSLQKRYGYKKEQAEREFNDWKWDRHSTRDQLERAEDRIYKENDKEHEMRSDERPWNERKDGNRNKRFDHDKRGEDYRGKRRKAG